MDSMQKLQKLYHGSSERIDGPLQPILRQGGPDYLHNRAVVFATEREDVAALFMLHAPGILSSIGFEEGVPYACVWGTPEEFTNKDHEGFMYVLPGNSFEKVGKEYEWQSSEPVPPIEVKRFNSALEG